MSHLRTRRASAAHQVSCGAFSPVVLAVVLLSVQSAAATTLKTLHSFCAKQDCFDGQEPRAGVVRDSAGNIFGTTSIGGKENAGVVFEVSADGKERVLHHFCISCSDGRYPQGNLIIDTAGNLYGTTDRTAFELIPNADRSKWHFIVLRNFSGDSGINGLSYQGLQTGAAYDGVSPLFGTIEFPGGFGMTGTVFELDSVVGKRERKEKVLYTFCETGNCTDGAQPEATVILDKQGNLYGTTSRGGSDEGVGVVFELSPGKRSYSETVLYTFCQLAGCADGGNPQTAPLAMDSNGDLYGTAGSGGASNEGLVFRIEPNGTQSAYTVLYTFCPDRGACADGARPAAGVIIAPDGDLIGSATLGGPNGGGAIFKLQGTTESVLYGFGAKPNFQDGSGPVGSVLLDSSGMIFGTTLGGGKPGNKTGFADGTVWQLTP